MKHLLSLSIIAIMLLIAGACTHAGAQRKALSLDAEAPVAPQAAALVTDNSPADAAVMLVEWLADAPTSSRNFAMDFTREVYRRYTMPPYSDSLELFAGALERAKDSLPLDKQVNVFVAVSSPDNLGQMLRNDPQADTIASLIVARYGNDSSSISSFLNALNP